MLTSVHEINERCFHFKCMLKLNGALVTMSASGTEAKQATTHHLQVVAEGKVELDLVD